MSEEKKIVEYIPKQIQSNKNVPAPVYELKTSLVGKIDGPIVIGTKDIKIKVPYAPKSNCKKCFGKGYVGIDIKNKQIFICQKCYPKLTLSKI